MSKIVNDAISLAKSKYLKSLSDLTVNELHDVISTSVMSEIADDWMNSRNKRIKERLLKSDMRSLEKCENVCCVKSKDIPDRRKGR